MGARLMAGQQTLNLYVEVRLLCPQPEHIKRTVMSVAVLLIFEKKKREKVKKRFLGRGDACVAPTMALCRVRPWRVCF